MQRNWGLDICGYTKKELELSLRLVWGTRQHDTELLASHFLLPEVGNVMVLLFNAERHDSAHALPFRHTRKDVTRCAWRWLKDTAGLSSPRVENAVYVYDGFRVLTNKDGLARHRGNVYEGSIATIERHPVIEEEIVYEAKIESSVRF